MALVFADLVQENTSTTGVGTLTLTGAVSPQFQTFSAIGDANTTYYRIISGNDSEIGLGTYTTSGAKLSRDTVLQSIIGGVAGTTKITVAAGATVICTYPAERVVIQDATNNVNVPSATVGVTGNYQSLVGAVTTKTPIHSVAGTDPNISLALQSKGTGGIDLVAGSSGVNISNGATVTAITRTVAGTGYTTLPTVNISAPTIAGGVQAVLNVLSLQLATTPVITAGGTGYVVNDLITFVGGTGTAGSLTVTSVSGGVITGVSITSYAGYSVVPTSPISTIGGTGTGATFTVAGWQISPPTITNAGSGYIEQPTITFSGGGGSGAAAYASVGNTATIKGLYGGGSQIPIQFAGPSGNLLQIMEIGNTSSPVPLVVKCGDSYTQLYPNGSNIPLQFSSSGTGTLNFYTNTLAQQQLAVAHTASAVNYVQVTGGATGTSASISSQGSDSNIGLILQSKSASVVFLTRPAQGRSFNILDSVTPANYLQVVGSASTAAPILSAQGSDTNISLALTPKGTGIVLTNQNTPVAYNATATLLIADVLSQIITSTSATAVALTLPTGTLTDAGISAGTSAVNTAFEWSIINLGSAVGIVTLRAGTGHTIVGLTTLAIVTSARFKTVKTATNTFITYRIA